jgi:hypothetical protein
LTPEPQLLDIVLLIVPAAEWEADAVNPLSGFTALGLILQPAACSSNLMAVRLRALASAGALFDGWLPAHQAHLHRDRQIAA